MLTEEVKRSWLARAHPNVNPGLLEARSEGAQVLLRSLGSRDQMAGVVEIAFGVFDDMAAAQNLRQAFKEQDRTFPMEGNEFELSGLAALTLALAFDSNHDRAPQAAMSVATASFASDNTKEVAPELITLAESFLLKGGIETREFDGTMAKINAAGPFKAGITNAMTSLVNAVNKTEEQISEEIAAAGKKVADQLSETFSTFANQVNRALEAAENKLNVAGEELQILWWAFSGVSRGSADPLRNLGKHEAILGIGKELADLVEFVPGPSNAIEFIRFALSMAKPAKKSLSALDAVNATSLDWRGGVVADVGRAHRPTILPLHQLIRQKLDGTSIFSDKDEWVMRARPAEDIAYQMYLERLIATSVGN